MTHAWTWPELRKFLLDNGLVTATGAGGFDEIVLTVRGAGLLAVLAIFRAFEERDS